MRRARAEGKRVRVVTGHFDPILAVHARRLGELAEASCMLVVVITEPERPILAAQARAVLVAALAAVDLAVVPAPRPLEEVLALLQPDDLCRQEADDERLTRDLMLHVQSRHS